MGSKENIWVACSDGDFERVSELIQAGTDVNGFDENGYSPIHAAVSYSHIDVIQLLLSAGANPNLRDPDGDCPLHVVETPEVADILLSNGADPTLLNNAGETIMDKAIQNGLLEMIGYFSQKGFTACNSEQLLEDDGDANFEEAYEMGVFDENSDEEDQQDEERD